MVEKLKYGDFSSGLPFSVVRSQPQRPRESHTHDFHEIVVVTSGVGLHVCPHTSWPVQAGDVFVIGGKYAHYYDNVHDLGLINVLFQPRQVDLKQHDIASLEGFQALFSVPDLKRHREFRSRFHLNLKDLSMVLGHVDALEQELQSKRPGWEHLSYLHFHLIVASLSRLYSEHTNIETDVVLRVAQAINYLEANWTKKLSIAKLASVAGMSSRTLQRLFLLATGTSPHDYLLQLRINKAARALRSPEISVTEIAFDVGFNDSGYFSRQFKKRLGATPSDYRKEQLALA